MGKRYMILEKSICRELEILEEKYRNGQEMNEGDIRRADLLSHTLKSLVTVSAMKQAEEYDSGQYYNQQMNNGSYMNNSYDARGNMDMSSDMSGHYPMNSPINPQMNPSANSWMSSTNNSQMNSPMHRPVYPEERRW